jgi:hypothetical protein
MDDDPRARKRGLVSYGIVISGCLMLVALGVVSAAGVAGVSSLLVPVGVLIVLMTTVELLIARRL